MEGLLLDFRGISRGFMNLVKLCTSFVTAFAVAALVSGCSVSDSEDGEYSKWTFSGSVVSGANGLGLEGASIDYMDGSGKQKTAYTDESGAFFIDGLPYGQHTFTFSHYTVDKKDTLYYAPKIITVASTGESSYMEGVVASGSHVVRLSPLNAGIAGELYVQEEATGVKSPAPKVKLRLAHQDTAFVNIAPETFSATTDSLGRFTFNKLPADSGLTLSAEPFTYKGKTYRFSNTALPRLRSDAVHDMGRIFLVRDTLKESAPVIVSSNVMDNNRMGYKNLSPLITPYYVFSEALSKENISVSLAGDSATVLTPEIKGDTLYLRHTAPLAAEKSYSVSIVGYTKKGERLTVDLSGDAAFTTNRGLYAVTSNAWAASSRYKATFSVNDTLWVKFSDSLATVQWSKAAKVKKSIYADNESPNADAWIKADTLFVKMFETFDDSLAAGDTVGMNITAHAKNGLYLQGLTVLTELSKAPVSSSSEASGSSEASSSSAESSSSVASSSSSSSSSAAAD